MIASRTLTTWLRALTPLLLVACGQADGEVCQNDRDCDDGLVCDIEHDDRGVCRDPSAIDAGSDAGRELAPDPRLGDASAGDGGAGAPDEDAGSADQDGG